MIKGILIALWASTALASTFIEEVQNPIEKAFVPVGFDNDDAVQIMVTGKFPDGCFQLGEVSSVVNSHTKEISLSISAYRYEGTCLPPGAPYYQMVYLGMIHKAGVYTLIDDVTREKIGELSITPAPTTGSGTDSNAYASLTDAFLAKHDGKNVLVMRGLFNKYCGGLEKVEFEVHGDVLVVLPKMSTRSSYCHSLSEPAETTALVTVNLPPSPFLLHVRTQGGQSINKLN